MSGQPTWFHCIDLPDGSVTPGTFDTRPTVGLIPWPDLTGARCLDLGTCDGFWAFEMERRGAAEVIAIDIDARDPRDQSWQARQRTPTAPPVGALTPAQRFEIARQALGSRVRRVTASVYDLDPAVHGHFDVVFWGNMLVHLRDPALALERVQAVCAGDLVMVDCVDTFLDLVSPNTPGARFSPARDQWWRHNRAGLNALLERCGFQVMAASATFITPFGARFNANSGRLSFLRRALSRHVGRHPSSPILTRVLGLLSGTHDIAIRARPRKA